MDWASILTSEWLVKVGGTLVPFEMVARVAMAAQMSWGKKLYGDGCMAQTYLLGGRIIKVIEGVQRRLTVFFL